MRPASSWPPALVLAVGAALATLGVRAQRSLPLRAGLAETVPAVFDGYGSRDLTLSAEEARAAGVSTYLARVFTPSDTASAGATPAFAMLYVGYYDRQTQGRTIHSPRNCLPGSGWEPLTNELLSVPTEGGTVTVNRYLLQKGTERALVLYWYQGRGRVASNEYRVKWDLLRDAALRRRSDEALVRIMVPMAGADSVALRLALSMASRIMPAVARALPA